MTEQVIIYLNGSTEETMLAEGERFFKDYGYLKCEDYFIQEEDGFVAILDMVDKSMEFFDSIDEALKEVKFYPSPIQKVEEIKRGWTSYDSYEKVEDLELEVWALKSENKWFLEALKKDLLEAGILETDVNDKIKQALLSIGIKYD